MSAAVASVLGRALQLAAAEGDGFHDGDAIIDAAGPAVLRRRAAAVIEAQGIPLTGSDPRLVAFAIDMVTPLVEQSLVSWHQQINAPRTGRPRNSPTLQALFEAAFLKCRCGQSFTATSEAAAQYLGKPASKHSVAKGVKAFWRTVVRMRREVRDCGRDESEADEIALVLVANATRLLDQAEAGLKIERLRAKSERKAGRFAPPISARPER